MANFMLRRIENCYTYINRTFLASVF
jgi:hypothetical protein